MAIDHSWKKSYESRQPGRGLLYLVCFTIALVALAHFGAKLLYWLL